MLTNEIASTATGPPTGPPTHMLTPPDTSNLSCLDPALANLPPSSGGGTMAPDGFSMAGMSPFHAALSEATGGAMDHPSSSAHVDTDNACLAPMNDFDSQMMFDFGDLAQHALLQPDGNLAPLMHLDHTFSDSGNSSAYQDNAFVDTPRGPLSAAHGGFPAGSREDDLQQVPFALKQAVTKPSKYNFTEEMRQDLLRDIRNRSLGSFLKENELPSAKVIQASLRSYIDCFDPHLPFIHIPSFIMDGAPSPLVLAMCAIGSLYRLERKIAGDFYSLSQELIDCCGSIGPKPRLRRMSSIFDATPKTQIRAQQEQPVWTVQCKLLLNFFALFGWDGALAEHALEDFLSLSQVIRSAKSGTF